jgi:hypothetical protein
MSLKSVSCLGQVSDISDIYLMCLTDVPDIGECLGGVSDIFNIYLRYLTDVPEIS